MPEHSGATTPTSAPPVRLPNHPTAAREGRRYLRESLGAWAVHDDVVDIVTLLTSEVITNAVRHAPPPLDLSVYRRDATIRVEITDSDPRPPTRSRPDFESVDGRGLWLLDVLAVSWGYHPEGDGKCVWFEVSATPPALRGLAGH
jgi:anti-sigma regulatory factor (Ser/Thr protein kinase)